MVQIQFFQQSHPQVAEVEEEDLLQVMVQYFQVNPAVTAVEAAEVVPAQALVQEVEVMVIHHQ